MGIDFLDMTFRVEKEFNIRFREGEITSLHTVSDLITVIRNRVAAANTQPFLTLGAFRSLRDTVRSIKDDPTRRISTQDQVVRVLNKTQRRDLWSQLSEILGTPPDSLRRPVWLRWFLWVVVIGIFVMTFYLFAPTDYTLPALAASLILMPGLLLTTRPFCSVPPKGWSTFGEIALQIVKAKAIPDASHFSTDEQILHALRPLIAEALGLDETEITPEARFIEDLGAD